MNKPILIVTSDKWARDTYIVFEDDPIAGFCIPDDWIDDRMYALECDGETEITREQLVAEMEKEFFADNSDVDEFWPEYNICRSGDDYYRYDDNGADAKWLGNFDSIQEALDCNK